PIIDWGFRFQRPQQLMSRFAAAGHRVFYVGLTLRAEGPPYELRPVAENVYEVSLRGPALNVYTGALDAAGRDEVFAGLDALRREAGLGATAVFVQLPFWWPVAARARDALAWTVVYDCMDDHAGFSTNRPQMLDQEQALLEGAALVLASSRVLYDRCRAANANTLLLPNACDYAHFAAVPMRAPGPRPVVGYYGAIADWFDADLVADLAQRRPHWDFLLVGSTFSADTSRLQLLDNVTLAGEQPYADLPSWIARMDVLLLPFKRLPLTEATSPVKLYEILAAGKPLVSVPLPEVSPLQPLVRTAGSAAEFDAAVSAALAEEGAGPVEERRRFARANTWQQRFEELLPRVREAFPRASVVVVTYNNEDLNRQCLESVYARTEWPHFELIVVDNASGDGTPALLEREQARRERLAVVLNRENRGFAAANNQGLEKASGAFLVLLNNDTVVSRGWLTALVRHLTADPYIGLVGPVTNAIANA
ncbi:MAG TPA: glycosyltransferase, partial [Vicinamibacteria bacterium]|nr:glycosyltransferase [Vicinamibacteria bacterium]